MRLVTRPAIACPTCGRVHTCYLCDQPVDDVAWTDERDPQRRTACTSCAAKYDEVFAAEEGLLDELDAGTLPSGYPRLHPHDPTA